MEGMKPILAIDPGTTQSAFLLWNGTVLDSGLVDNQILLWKLKEGELPASLCAIEMIASYGMPVGREVFETCVWIGQFIERAGMVTYRVYRKDVKIHLCGTNKAKDGNIRQALIDKHGAPGTKKHPGRTYGIHSHLWAALAVADYAADTIVSHSEAQG
jgi:hypothetical protein